MCVEDVCTQLVDQHVRDLQAYHSSIFISTSRYLLLFLSLSLLHPLSLSFPGSFSLSLRLPIPPHVTSFFVFPWERVLV